MNFLGILVLSGYHKLPTKRAYWSLDEILAFHWAQIAYHIIDIKRNLHLADNSLVAGSNDKMFKVRLLCSLIQSKWGVFHENLSVDESMIKYFDCHSAKQFIMDKPVRFSYRN